MKLRKYLINETISKNIIKKIVKMVEDEAIKISKQKNTMDIGSIIYEIRKDIDEKLIKIETQYSEEL